MMSQILGWFLVHRVWAALVAAVLLKVVVAPVEEGEWVWLPGLL